MSAARRGLLLGLLLGAALQAQELGELKFDFGLNMRLRGISLQNGTDIRMLDPSLRLALQDAGETEVDSQQNYLDMRVRPRMTISTLDVIKLETQLEIGDLTFGVGDGGDIGTDGRIIEVKHLFLDLDIPQLSGLLSKESSLTFRGGLFGTSTTEGIIMDDDGAGLRLRWALAKLNTTVETTWLKAIDSSRLDLDGDGRIDNDYNDRDLVFFAAKTAVFGVNLGLHFAADLDNTLDTPSAEDQEREMFWYGLEASARFGSFGVDLYGCFNHGETSNAAPDGRGVDTEAWAGVLRLSYDFEMFKIATLAAAATGNDPDRVHQDDAFVAVSPAFEASNILYGFSGYNLTGSNLSGTACFSVEVSAGIFENLTGTARALYAHLTSAPDISDNIFARGTDRDLGWEFNLNLEYQLYQPLRLFVDSGVLLPGDGLQATFDSSDDGEIWEVIFGIKLSL